MLGVLGLVERLVGRRRAALGAGETILLVGERDAAGPRHPLGGTSWAARRGRRGGVHHARRRGAPAGVRPRRADLVAPSLVGEATAVGAVRDVSGGGIAVALAELCMNGREGVVVSGLHGHAELFCEQPSRFLIATKDPDAVGFADAAGVPVSALGSTGGTRLVVEGLVDVEVDDLVAAAGRLAHDHVVAP